MGANGASWPKLVQGKRKEKDLEGKEGKVNAWENRKVGG
jgi:hypothetical protein